MDDLIQQIIGDCRILKKLGQGGMGSVYLAHNINLDIHVAIKILDPNLATSEEIVKRFFTEARSAAKLDSPHIVEVKRVGQDQNRYFIEMEFVEGESLRDRLQREAPIPYVTAIQYLYQICLGLAEAHKAGIVHRDIKPENILINTKGIFKIADFGLAKVLKETAVLTQAGQLLGTPYYLAPEQCEGKAADARSDIYSLGVTFYFMLTGRLPFTGDSVMATLVARLHSTPTPPRTIIPQLPEDIENLTLKMMARELSDRFQNMRELLGELGILIKRHHVPLPWLGVDLDMPTLPQETPQNNESTMLISRHGTEEPANDVTGVGKIIPVQAVLNELPPHVGNNQQTVLTSGRNTASITNDDNIPETRKYTEAQMTPQNNTPSKSNSPIQHSLTSQPLANTNPNLGESHQNTRKRTPVNIHNLEETNNISPAQAGAKLPIPSVAVLEESLRKIVPDTPITINISTSNNDTAMWWKRIAIIIGIVLIVVVGFIFWNWKKKNDENRIQQEKAQELIRKQEQERQKQKEDLEAIKLKLDKARSEQRYDDFFTYLNEYYTFLDQYTAWKDEDKVYRWKMEDGIRQRLRESSPDTRSYLINRLRSLGPNAKGIVPRGHFGTQHNSNNPMGSTNDPNDPNDPNSLFGPPEPPNGQFGPPPHDPNNPFGPPEPPDGQFGRPNPPPQQQQNTPPQQQQNTPPQQQQNTPPQQQQNSPPQQQSKPPTIQRPTMPSQLHNPEVPKAPPTPPSQIPEETKPFYLSYYESHNCKVVNNTLEFEPTIKAGELSQQPMATWQIPYRSKRLVVQFNLTSLVKVRKPEMNVSLVWKQREYQFKISQAKSQSFLTIQLEKNGIAVLLDKTRLMPTSKVAESYPFGTLRIAVQPGRLTILNMTVSEE